MKKLVIGILAHVDAGKTTLSEALLYLSGTVRKIGRVDKGDAFLDTYELEKSRGITIFSKQAQFSIGEIAVTLLDTPGHVDFSPEMERTLQVLDAAVLVINGADGVQGHTRTLWRLLKQYRIPVFLFINKMDQPGTAKDSLIGNLRAKLDENCIDFGEERREVLEENIAMSNEAAMECYLEHGFLAQEEIVRLIRDRHVFPCFFGSALKLEGVEELMEAIGKYAFIPSYPKEFGARVFKIARDELGNRLTYMKVTGGVLPVRAVLSNSTQAEKLEEKVNQIRIYSGAKFETVNEAAAGTVCAVTGLSGTFPGEGLGIESGVHLPFLAPVLTYQVLLPEGCDAAVMLPKLKQLEEEEPQLHIAWEEGHREIHAQLMGQVQTEVLKSLVAERFGVDIELGNGSILFKETIVDTVEGVGHFEPLRHYAEVHLILEPGEPGSGVEICSDCSEDMLDKNWQRLVMSHLTEKTHRGILTNSPVTDMRITLVAGKAHIKHTEGGDFRQATYRAVRQGLMQASAVLLEPYYEFQLEVPESMIGRAMSDIERMYGSFKEPEYNGDMAMISGSAPVSEMQNYQSQVAAYTKGYGRLFCTLKGYEPCHNQEEVISRIGYDCDKDTENPSGSVFCAHGAGYVVPWETVKNHMHIESQLEVLGIEEKVSQPSVRSASAEPAWIGEDEVERILSRTFYANSKKENMPRKWKRTEAHAVSSAISRPAKKEEARETYLLVDGYNIIFAWKELKVLAESNIDGARERLLEIMSNYQAMKGCHLIVVFDAYRVSGHVTELIDYHNIHVVYTKEAETADQYIEKFAQENGKKYDVTVATSDGLEQIIILGRGCALLSARELEAEVELIREEIREGYLNTQPGNRNYLLSSLSEEEIRQLKKE